MLTRVLSRRRGQVLAHPPVSLFKLDRQSLYFRGAMRTKQVVGPLLGLLSFFPPFAAAQDSAKSAKLTIEQLIEIKHPSNPVWSPDGKHVVFTWDRAGVANLYVANADGHGQPQALTSYPEGQVEEAFWNEDGDAVYFPRDGDLWQVPVSGGTPKTERSKQDRATGLVPSPDSRR